MRDAESASGGSGDAESASRESRGAASASRRSADAIALAGSEASGRETATAAVERALSRAVESQLGAFWAIDREGAPREAARLDEARAGGETVGSLAGVPVAVKDCFDVAGLPTTGGVAGDHAPAGRDAEAVARLRAAGAVPIGKAAMDQLGWSLAGLAPGFPPCLSPIDPALSPGGSSTGAAVAVAAGIAGLGLGVDLAGSVRVPAAFCGVVGLKPPSGTIPTGGSLAFVPSFEVVGVLAAGVQACTTAYGALAAVPPPAVEAPERVALLEDQLEAADPVVTTVLEAAVQRLEHSGLQVEPVRLDWSPPGFGSVLAIELARTWGPAVERAPDRFTEDIRRSVAYGAGVTDSRAEDVRRELARSASAVEQRLAGWDALIGPTVPVPVPPVSRPATVRELTTNTRPFSALRWPAFSVPGGADASGRPVGIQVASSPDRFGRLIAVAAALEA